MNPRALLLDVDGTLVDSMFLHVTTWCRALDEAGATVPHVEVHRRIGMDGATIIRELLELADVDPARRGQVGDHAEELHSRYYREQSDRLRVLPGARDLVRRAHENGWIVVLASSAPPAELDTARALLDVDRWVDAVTDGEDVETAKPDPAIVRIALQRAGVEPGRALMVGDATWDALAAGRIGVRSVAVRTGGIGDDALRAAGYARVVDDAAAVAELLDDPDLLVDVVD